MNKQKILLMSREKNKKERKKERPEIPYYVSRRENREKYHRITATIR